MVAKPDISKQTGGFGWRAVAVSLLTIVGLVFLTAFTLVHWTERQILTTDNWIKVVGPLPKNDQVATALSTYTVDQLFTASDLENRISQALPDRASFLAPTLTDQLDARLTKRTKQIIQSDQFTNIWVAANKTAHERLLASARGETPTTASKPSHFNLNLDAVRDSVGSLVNKDPGQAAPNHEVGISVDTKTSLNKLKDYINWADFLNATLGLAAIVCLLAAIVITHKRRRLIMLMSLLVVTIALLQLSGVKALQPVIINRVQNVSYRPAVSVVYDTLVNSFRHSAGLMVIIGLIIFMVAWLSSTTYINRNKYLGKQLEHYCKSNFYDDWLKVRLWFRRYLWHLVITIVLIGLTIMAFASGSLDWQGIIRCALFIILGIETANLIATRAREAPMKQPV